MRLRRLLRGAVAAAGLAALQGCALRNGEAPAAIRRSDTRIVADELRAGTQSNLYEFISAARPAWLRPRARLEVSRGTQAQIVVYVDGMRRGGQDMLRTLPLSSVLQVDYLSPSAADLRFGGGHQHGAILVTSGSAS